MTLEDSGEYRCIVRSVVGEISSTTMLFVDGPPGPPGKFCYKITVISIFTNKTSFNCPINV